MEKISLDTIFDTEVLQQSLEVFSDVLNVSLEVLDADGSRCMQGCSAETEKTLCWDITAEEQTVARLVVKGVQEDNGKKLVKLFDVMAMQMSAIAQQRMIQKRQDEQRKEGLEQAGVLDPLTGLNNREKFEKVMAQSQEQRPKQLCIISVDANNLKLMNDIFGHKAGDAMLQAVGQKLLEVAKPSWTVARCGGDEFRVLLPDTSIETAHEYSKRVMRNCQSARALNLPLSVAMGVAQWEVEEESLEECFARADAIMYENKKEMKQKQNLLDYILEKLYDKQYLDKDIVEPTEEMTYDFSVHLGFDKENAAKLAMAAKYQDIGLIHMPESLMIQGEAGTQEELGMLHDHVEKGYCMALQFERTHSIAEFIRMSHENWDGSGYPKHLSGAQLPLEARLIHTVSDYVHLTVGQGMNDGEAIDHMKQQTGIVYEPELLKWFDAYLTGEPAILFKEET